MGVIANSAPCFREGERGEELARVEGADFVVLTLSRVDAPRSSFRVAIFDAFAERWIWRDVTPENISDVDSRIVELCRLLAPPREGATVDGITQSIEHARPLDFFFGRRLSEVQQLRATARAAAAEVRRNLS